MSDILTAIAARLSPEATAALVPLLAEVKAERSRLPVVFPGLPRRLGRNPLTGGVCQIGPGTIDLAAFRSCDLGAAWLLLSCAATMAELRDLYAHGDLEERAMLLRAMHLLPVGPVTVEFFGEVQRTNVLLHMEAGVCDGDLFARTVGRPGFALETANKVLLKYAFNGLPLHRVIGAEKHANPTLSRMLQDLATEREAAGRAVWSDTWRMIGRAPTEGSAARLIGGLEHGDDNVRRAAAEGLLALLQADPNGHDLRRFAAERLPREPRPEIRDLLQQITSR